MCNSFGQRTTNYKKDQLFSKLHHFIAYII